MQVSILLIFVVDLRGTALVAGSLDVAWAVGAGRCEGTRASWLACGGRADGRALKRVEIRICLIETVGKKRLGYILWKQHGRRCKLVPRHPPLWVHARE